MNRKMTAIVVVYDSDEEESDYRLFETLEQAVLYAEEQVKYERYSDVIVATITHRKELVLQLV